MPDEVREPEVLGGDRIQPERQSQRVVGGICRFKPGAAEGTRQLLRARRRMQGVGLVQQQLRRARGRRRYRHVWNGGYPGHRGSKSAAGMQESWREEVCR